MGKSIIRLMQILGALKERLAYLTIWLVYLHLDQAYQQKKIKDKWKHKEHIYITYNRQK